MSRHNHLVHFHVSKKKNVTLFDKIIIVAAFLYPLTGLPQVLAVFSEDATGVSLLSWIGFVGFSILFLIYGLIHKITPIIITNILWLAVGILVVVGLTMNTLHI